jgi:CDP-diacylglycerol--glycerol-3-phosphate 3-phosphatidyltransferase
MERLRDFLHDQIAVVLTPVARLLLRLKITANQVSFTGLALNLSAAALIVGGYPAWAGALFLFAGTFDLLDGVLARLSETDSPFGAFVDSIADRISEGVVFAAIVYRFALEDAAMDATMAVLALLTGVLVSYARARAEGLGVPCKVGILTRAERVVLVAAGLLFGILPVAIYLLIGLSVATVWQRIAHTARLLDSGR